MAFDADTQPLGPLSFEVPAVADRLAEIRRRLLNWLTPLGVPDAVAADIVLVVNEACTNSIEHAYRNTDSGVIEIEAMLEDGRIAVCIADFGAWRKPPSQPSTRGRGLPIMRAVSNRVDLDTSTAGTTVRMTFDIMETSRRA